MGVCKMKKKAPIKKIQKFAFNMKKHLLDTAFAAGESSAHVGGALSSVEINATLFSDIMRYKSQNPEWEERDRFILSKGHACLGLYTALVEAGFFPAEDLKSFEKTGTYLLGHTVKNRQKGIEFSGGSLGMGLALGIGVCLSGKKRKFDFKVYVLLGDGECNEGSVWEAAMAASHFKLNNLIAIVDRNKFQQTGKNKDIMDLGDLGSKWKSFGWETIEVDGHNIKNLYEALTRKRSLTKPYVLIANTTKGKGFSFTENNNDWHHSVLSRKHYELAISELMATKN